jgi:hypothetical protein
MIARKGNGAGYGVTRTFPGKEECGQRRNGEKVERRNGRDEN